jgi:predicted alpha/beta superfamily hydrolase
MEKALQKAGFVTHNINYPSTSDTIENLAKNAIPPVVEECKRADAAAIHFVTHSMGGILVRYYLEHVSHPECLGRVVMIAPPNHGSKLVDFLRGKPVLRQTFDFFLGHAGGELGTSQESTPNKLGSANFTLGIIAGRYDCKVKMESARLEGMTDLIVLPYTHTLIIVRSKTFHQTIFFLQNGTFDIPCNASKLIFGSY